MLDIIKLQAQGHSMRAIARMTGLSRVTVQKYLQNPQTPRYSSRHQMASKLEPFKEHLLARLAEGVFNSNRLLGELRDKGYSGGRTILKDFLKPFRPATAPRAVVRFEVLPGQQAQVDFGVFTYLDGKVTRRVYAFVMVLSYSRAMYVQYVRRQDLGTLLKCHLEAFEALGGVPERVLYDNMKPVVLAHRGSEVEFNPRFLDFALVVGFIPQACRPYRAQTKGRVERAIRYLRQNFWPALKFSDLDDLNAQARAWCQNIANVRIHGTTGRTPREMLTEEKLRALPPRTRLLPYMYEERKVARDGFVSYAGSRYGVPWKLCGRSVQVRQNALHVEVWHKDERVATLPRALLRGSTVPLPGQWSGLSMAQPTRREVLALRVPAPEVEVRPLSAYEIALEEVVGRG